jgi:hypothetical protein
MEVGNRHRLAAVLAAFVVMLLVPATGVAANDSFATTEPATNVMFTQATLNGTANADPGSSYYFEWGSTTCRDNRTPETPLGTGSQRVSATITKLTPGATYCFHLVVRDVLSGGGVAFHTGNDLLFKTPVPAAVATTSDATSVTSTSARLNGIVNNTTDPASAWKFEYGPSSSYGSATPSHAVGLGLTVVSLKITPASSLGPSTTSVWSSHKTPGTTALSPRRSSYYASAG